MYHFISYERWCYLLNFILDTFKNNPDYNYVSLDGKGLSKSQIAVTDLDKNIIEISKDVFWNLSTVREVRFSHVPTVEELNRNL